MKNPYKNEMTLQDLEMVNGGLRPLAGKRVKEMLEKDKKNREQEQIRTKVYEDGSVVVYGGW